MASTGLWETLRAAWKDRPRRRQLIITDITRMEGRRVCVGGYLADGGAIRPVVDRGGPDETWLQSARGGPLTAFSVVELRVARAPKRSLAPHTEDRIVPRQGHRPLRNLSAAERRDLLERSASPSVREIFGAEVRADPGSPWGRYVRAGEGVRSLGTIRAARVSAVRYQHYAERNRWDYRLRFSDASGEEFQLAVVDLACRRALDALRDSGLSSGRAAASMLANLQRQTVFLRVGLARGWDRYLDRCYVQIMGVHGFSA